MVRVWSSITKGSMKYVRKESIDVCQWWEREKGGRCGSVDVKRLRKEEIFYGEDTEGTKAGKNLRIIGEQGMSITEL